MYRNAHAVIGKREEKNMALMTAGDTTEHDSHIKNHRASFSEPVVLNLPNTVIL